MRLLRSARDLGINIFDAAVVYGQYEGEDGVLRSRAQELLGKAFGDGADDVFICTKVGQHDEVSHRADFSASRVVEQVRQSMRRLRTDVLDICLLHAPSLREVRDGLAIEVLKTLQSAGWARAIGYSFEAEPDHVIAALEQPVDVLMLQYNLMDQECADVLDLAAERGVGVLVGGPLKRGYLTGRYRSIEDLPCEDDYWLWNARRNPGKVSEFLRRAAELADEAGTPTDLRDWALRYVLSKPGVASAIVGHRSIEEVAENVHHSESWPSL